MLRRASRSYRPACESLGLSAHAYSRHLQRLIVDFAAEGSFESSSRRLDLHHRVRASASSIRKLTLYHGEVIAREQKVEGCHSVLQAKGADKIITEMDGSMVPVVECQRGKDGDARKRRN